MPKSIHDRGLFRPLEVERLQRVFDAACRQRDIHPDSTEASDLALTLLALHNAGMTDEDMLMQATAFRMPDSKAG